MKGKIVSVKELDIASCKVQLFNGSHWNIREGKAYRYSLHRIENKLEEIEFACQDVGQIFRQIKIVFDLKQRIVAKRFNTNSHLLTTCEESLVFRFTPKNRNKKFLKKYNELINH